MKFCYFSTNARKCFEIILNQWKPLVFILATLHRLLCAIYIVRHMISLPGSSFSRTGNFHSYWQPNRLWLVEVEIFLKSSGKFRSLYATSRSRPIDHTDTWCCWLYCFYLFTVFLGWQPNGHHYCPMQPGWLRPHRPLLPGLHLEWFHFCYFWPFCLWTVMCTIITSFIFVNLYWEKKSDCCVLGNK